MLFHGCHASYLLYSVYTDKYLCCSLQKAMAVLCVFGGDLTLCKQVTGWKARPATAGDVLSELQSPSWRAPLPQGTPPPACLPTGALGQEPQVVLRMGPTPPQGPPPGHPASRCLCLGWPPVLQLAWRACRLALEGLLGASALSSSHRRSD